MADDGWEKFNGEPALPTQERMHVTIGPKRKILINANLYKAWGRPAAVHLLFHRELNQIALQPTSPSEPSAFPIKENRKCFQIMAAPFCRHFHLTFTTTHKFPHPKLTPDGKMILNLNETVLVSRTVRKA